MRFLYWAALGTMFTFMMTALGSALVFVFRRPMEGTGETVCPGFAGGVMGAAAVFSLLLPAFDMARGNGVMLIAVCAGFAAGCALIPLMERALLSMRQIAEKGDEGRRLSMMLAAITLHNIPEGMAVALACAQAARGDGAALAAASALALGVGIQNFPEGAAVSLPLRSRGMSRKKSFAIGALSGAVEPVFGLLAVMIASLAAGVLPVLMALAAGAMLCVVSFQMLPQAAKSRAGAVSLALGFALMTALDLML